MTSAPLLVTLRMDHESFTFFETLRQRHFPPERNKVPAHLTLFHALPGNETNAISGRLEKAAQRESFPMQVASVWHLGQGVAYRLASPALLHVRAELVKSWNHWLSPQDAAPFHPHVTVQNKVSAETSKALYGALSESFIPFSVWAEGLALWLYRGHWEKVQDFAFNDTPAVPATEGIIHGA